MSLDVPVPSVMFGTLQRKETTANSKDRTWTGTGVRLLLNKCILERRDLPFDPFEGKETFWRGRRRLDRPFATNRVCSIR